MQSYTTDIFSDIDVSDEPTLTHELTYDEIYSPVTIIANFKDCNIRAIFDSDNLTDEIELLPQHKSLIPIETHSNIMSVILEISNAAEDAFIYEVAVELLYMGAVHINYRDLSFIQNPEQGFTVGINLKKALTLAAGYDKIRDKEVQILYPNGLKIPIRKSNDNFQWRGKVLYCKLPVGAYKVRARYKTDNGWVNWSGWRNFRSKRKMTL